LVTHLHSVDKNRKIFFVNKNLYTMGNHNYIINNKTIKMEFKMPENDKNKKEYIGRFYGMRLKNDRDKEIRNTIIDMSKKKKIPANQLIFDYLEKGLNLNANKTINFNQDVLYDNFNLFMGNAFKKISNLEYQLFQKNYKKKTSLSNFIHNKYPEELQRKEFYLTLIYNQIFSELILLDTFFSLIDKDSNKSIGYFSYLCYKENIIDNSENFSTQLRNLKCILITKWYYKLKTANVVRNMEDFFNVNFNFIALEVLIFELYKGKKLKRSSKEERIKWFVKAYDEKKDKTTKEWGVSYRLDQLFKQIIQYIWNLPNFIQNIDQDDYQLFFKIGLKPRVFYDDIFDFDGYINYLKDNNLRRVLSDCLGQKRRFYSFLNDYYSLPPFDLIVKIHGFISFYNKLDNFIKELPTQLENNHYSLNEIEKMAIHLDRIVKNPSVSLLQQLIKDIPFDNLKNVFFAIPDNYNTVLDSIKALLMKFNINLNKIIEEADKEVTNRHIERKNYLLDSYPEDIKNKIIKILADLKKEKK